MMNGQALIDDMPAHHEGTLLISASDVQATLTLRDCIVAVENAFRLYAEGRSLKTGLLHIDAAEGEFHIKAGGLNGEASRFGAKINGGFFRNCERYGMPNIQGMIVLCDGDNGFPLAIMDSVEITRMRTGAATAIAAKYLARRDSRVVTVCGYGTQARIQLLALKQVLAVSQVFVFGRDATKAREFSKRMAEELLADVTSVSSLEFAAANSDVILTCTPSRVPFLMKDFILPGTFIAAIGADSPGKQELDSKLTSTATFVADILEQCEQVGELHHAISNSLMTRDDVHAELGEIIAGAKQGRTSDDEITIFDSTGTALQDVAAATLVYERALELAEPNFFNISG